MAAGAVRSGIEAAPAMVRNPDGSLAFTGVMLTGVGAFTIVMSVLAILAMVVWHWRVPRFRVVQVALGCWGLLGVVGGAVLIALPHWAVPGKLY